MPDKETLVGLAVCVETEASKNWRLIFLCERETAMKYVSGKGRWDSFINYTGDLESK